MSDQCELQPTQEAQSSQILGSTDASSAARPWGRFLSLSAKLEPVDLLKFKYTLGRFKGSDIVISEPAASNNHALLETQVDSSIVFLHDLSTNGTFVNGARIGKNRKMAICNGDEIAFAHKSKPAFIFQSSRGPPTIKVADSDDLNSMFYVAEVLGRGATGEVRRAVHRRSGVSVALKIVDKRKFLSQPKTLQRVRGEAQILMRASHPNIVGLHAVFESENNFYLVIEYIAGGELFDLLSHNGALTEICAKAVFFQLLHSVKHLHKRGIIHRDLKPENILLTNFPTIIPDNISTTPTKRATRALLFIADSQEVNEHRHIKSGPDLNFLRLKSFPVEFKDINLWIKLTDFGLARLNTGDISVRMDTVCGTPNYSAPEVLRATLSNANSSTNGSGGYSRAVDVWSLGVILYVLLCGYPPFSENHEKRKNSTLIQQILHGEYDMDEEYWSGVSTGARDIVRRMLTVDPEKRITIEECFGHSWLQNSDFLEYMNILYQSALSSMESKEPRPDDGKTTG